MHRQTIIAQLVLSAISSLFQYKISPEGVYGQQNGTKRAIEVANILEATTLRLHLADISTSPWQGEGK